MESFKYFRIFLSFSLLLQVFAVPVQKDEFCGGNGLYKYEKDQEYVYDYKTETTLWINDVSDEAKSMMTLKSTIVIVPVGPCSYLMKMKESTLEGESLNKQDSSKVVQLLDSQMVQFRLNQQGELDSQIEFQLEDKQWSRNIKRAIISAFQIKSQNDLRDLGAQKSATVYETDILGRCRTTYKLEQQTDTKFKLNKMKSLQRCTLNENLKASAIQYVPYKTLPEFFQGRLFVEDYECNSIVENNMLNSVECRETSTYKVGSRGRLGAQAIVNQQLTFKESRPVSATPTTSWQKLSIKYEFDTVKPNEPESFNFNPDKIINDICEKGLKQGLTNEHSDNFRDLVITMRSYSTVKLTQLYETSKNKCNLASMTISQALLFTDTDSSFEAVLSLMDKNAFEELKYITEYPLLTALARNQYPSKNLIEKLKIYLNEKQQQDFPYLNKLYLIYSTLIKTYCNKNECKTSQLEIWASIFERNLESDCSKDSSKEIVVSSLKAIGNIGYFKQIEMISNCAMRKENSLEIRVNAIQALRRFSCEQMEDVEFTYELLEKVDEDTEIRINSFLSLMRCSDHSERFQRFAQNKLANLLLKEEDIQLITYIIDYGKEHELTTVLNAVLSDPKIIEKFQVNFKELSWNNYRHTYSVMRDSSVEVETSVIYTPKTFIPRSIRMNATFHIFGMSVNFLEANVRLEGLDETLKATLIDKLKSEDFLKRVMQQPEQLIQILNLVADKLNYNKEIPQISLGLRVYGSEVYYSRLDSTEEIYKLADYFKSPRENLYNQIQTIRNLFLIDSHIKQPLLNGLEFETSLDISAALLISKQSKRTDKKSKFDYNFDLENFYSASMGINRRYEVQINNANRLSLKKKSFANARLRMDVDGTKTNNSAVYNLNLTPVSNIPMLTLDGQFYKLSANSEYKQVNKFKVKQTEYQSCRTQALEKAFGGVHFCLSVKRPETQMKESLRYLFIEDFEQVMSEENDDDEVHHADDGHDHSQSLFRPSILLSGPYHYEVQLKNPNLIKTITFSAQLDKESGKYDFKADLSTKSSTASKVEEKTLGIKYTRQSKITNRGLVNKMNLEIRRPDNDLRFQALADFAYQQDELLAGNLVIDNKIVRDLLVQLNFGRNKTREENIVPDYYLDVLFDSKVDNSNPKRYKLSANITPQGKNIESTLSVERDTTQVINGDLKLTHNDETDSYLEYDVDLNVNTISPRKIKVTGRILADLLKSDIDLKMKYESESVKFEDARIKMAHFYNGQENAKSFVEFQLNLPHTPVNHGGKMLFNIDIATRKLNYLEIQLLKNQNVILSLFGDRMDKNLILFGIKDCKLETTVAAMPWETDNSEQLKSLICSMKRNQSNKKITNEIKVTRNEKELVSVDYTLKMPDFNMIREKSTEIPRQQIGGEFDVSFNGKSQQKFLVDLDFQSSVKNNKHEFNFKFETDNLIRNLVKIEKINSELSMDNGKLSARVEVRPVGQIKFYKLSSQSSSPRVNGDLKEFDINFEKTLADGTNVKTTGTAQYTFKDFKNFKTSVQVPKHYASEISLETKRTNSQDMFGYHMFQFVNKHLDINVERQLRVLIHNKTSSEMIVEASLKRGPLGSIAQNENLDILIDLKANTLMNEKQTELYEHLNFISKERQINLKHMANMARSESSQLVEFSTNAKYQNKQLLDHSFKYSRENTQITAQLKQNRFETFNVLGKSIKTNDCTLTGRVDRKMETIKYLLDLQFDLKCNDKHLVGEQIWINVLNKDTDAPKTNIKLRAQSGLYNFERAFELDHEKFTSQNGLIRMIMSQKSEKYSTEFAYKREINAVTKKVDHSTYQWQMQMPKQLEYGLKLRVEKPFLNSGKRNIQLDITLPTRKMKAVYQSNYDTQFDQIEDNEGEFNGTITLQWDVSQPNKQVTFTFMRQNALNNAGTSIFYVQTENHPRFNLLKFQIIRQRKFNETFIQPTFMYELKDGLSNRLDLKVLMSSDMTTNSFSLETSLVRPKFNIKYENKYEKYTGRLQYLGIRLGNLLKLNIDKESDPEERKISLEFTNPNAAVYTYKATSNKVNDIYTVNGILSRDSQKVSEIVSSFDSANNRFVVRIMSTQQQQRKYTLDFGMFNESLANAYLLGGKNNQMLGLASLAVVKHDDDHHDLVFSSKWNRFWSAMQTDILGVDSSSEVAQVNEDYNSYFGDVYAVLSQDLKPAVEGLRNERLALARELNLISESNEQEYVPLYKRAYVVYNSAAQTLTKWSLWTKKYSKLVSTFIPRLPIIEYNQVEDDKFENNLVIRRPTLNARNLYQFNAEYRNYIKQIGENILFVKTAMMRNNLASMGGVKSLYNKYRFRSLKDYTLVANVFNRRNIIGFDGEQILVQTRCKYLLTHETQKNRFSVVLNFNENAYAISLFAYGQQKSIDISYNKAAIDQKPVSFPKTIQLNDNNGVITLTRENQAVCAELNNDLRVCCYEDSSSCTIATTRWFTGKLNGLLGNTNKNVEKLQEHEWYLDSACKAQTSYVQKVATKEVSEQCHALFGQKSAQMKDALMAIRPNGWLKMCETVLTADSKAKCILLKSFRHYAEQQNVDVEPPKECYSCQLKSSKYLAGESVSKSVASLKTNFEKGSDYVFLTLPCNKSQYSIDLNQFVKRLKEKSPLNKYYVVSIDQYDTSIYQPEMTTEQANFDLKKAYETLEDDFTLDTIKKSQFNKGLYLAASLFSRRLAKNRFLVIRSCGNCLPYTSIDAIKYTKMINERNVVVHSWGDYEMKMLDNTDDDNESTKTVGYDDENLFYYNNNDKKLEIEPLNSYKLEHDVDLCSRLAVKTSGSVVDIKQLKVKEIMNLYTEMMQQKAEETEYEFKIKKCQKLDTSFGDLTDFQYTRTKIVKDD